MPNETILKARLIKAGRVECRFSRRGAGARNWKYIVDEWGDRLAEFASRTGRQVQVETTKTLGQGAVMILPRPDYARLRLRFETRARIQKAIERGEFRFDETAGVIEVLMDRLLRLNRKALDRRASDPVADVAAPEST